MYVGDKTRINVSSSRFSTFIKNGYLYIDKTAFIEHVLQDDSSVLLFTRPRRMGKSLNMDTLATFLDCKQNTGHLFKGLYIESSPEFNKLNQYPVVYLDFVNLDSSSLDGLKVSFRDKMLKIIKHTLKPEQLDYSLKEYINYPANDSPSILVSLMEVISECYDKEPILIVDEYDKVIMDTLNHPEGEEIKNFIVNALQSTLKGRTYFEKAILTGVTRTTKESLFSTLNNLEVYDILRESKYDADFSLTEGEMLELVSEDEIADVRKWYNNMRVGKEMLFNIYSVMSYLRNPGRGLIGYWSMTGGGGLLSSLLTDSRADVINQMLLADKQYEHEIILNSQMNMEYLRDISRCDDASFFTIAVQAGYFSFNPIEPVDDIYEVFIPNMEARRVWARLILDYQYDGVDKGLVNIFKVINNTDLFSKRLTDFTSMVLSYNDFKARDEWVYHVFFLGLVYSLGYECISNLESGLGRFDIVMKSRKFNAVIEFKVADSSNDAVLQKKADEAIIQIDEKEYWHELRKSPLPIYKIGIACHGKKCLVKTVLH